MTDTDFEDDFDILFPEGHSACCICGAMVPHTSRWQGLHLRWHGALTPTEDTA